MELAEKVAPASIFYFKVEGVPGKIQEKVADLRAAGVDVNGDAHVIARNWHGADVWLGFFKDPFGNPLALKSDVPIAGAADGPGNLKVENTIPALAVSDIQASIR